MATANFCILAKMSLFGNIYLHHRGLIINLISLSLFWVWQPRMVDGGGPLWLVLIIILALLAEPWAMYYSMGVFNARREELQIQPIWLHRQIGQTSLGPIFWAGRLSLIVGLIVSTVQKQTAEKFMTQEWLAVPCLILLMLREAWVVYCMASQRSFQKYSPQFDFLADAILVIIITAGELLFKSLMADYGVEHPSVLWEEPLRLFALVLFMGIFYLPIRYAYTLEDFTFAQTRWQKVERVGSFILVLIVLIMRT